MPFRVRKGKGKRPYKIVKKLPGGRTKVVGSSTTKRKAAISASKRKQGSKGK